MNLDNLKLSFLIVMGISLLLTLIGLYCIIRDIKYIIGRKQPAKILKFRAKGKKNDT